MKNIPNRSSDAWSTLAKNTLSRLVYDQRDPLQVFIHSKLLESIFSDIVDYYIKYSRPGTAEARIRLVFLSRENLIAELTEPDTNFWGNVYDKFFNMSRTYIKDVVIKYIEDNYDEIKHAVGVYMTVYMKSDLFKDFLKSKEVGFDDVVGLI